MTNRSKFILAAILMAAGLALILRPSSGKRAADLLVGNKLVSADDSAAQTPRETENSPRDQKSSSTSTAATASGSAGGASDFPGEQDVKDIIRIAKTASLDEAYTSYQIFAQGLLDEHAANQERIQTLLQATIDLSDYDPSNDHYAYLVPLWEKYPNQFMQALTAMDVDPETKDDIVATVKSFTESMKGASQN